MSGINRFVSSSRLSVLRFVLNAHRRQTPSSCSLDRPRALLHYTVRNYTWDRDDNQGNDDLYSDSKEFPVFDRPEKRWKQTDDRRNSFKRQNHQYSQGYNNQYSQSQRYNNQYSQRYNNYSRPSFSEFGSRREKFRNFDEDDEHNTNNFSQRDRFGRDNLGANIKEKDWTASVLSSIEKNFYVLHPDVAARSNDDVEAFYSKHNITVSRGERPVPLSDFHEANFPEKIVQYLERNKWSNPTHIQSLGWPIALSGKNMVGIAQTGSGKTLGFILPALVHIKHQRPVDREEGPIVLVLAPTRELAQQIKGVSVEYGRLLGIQSCSIFGGQSKLVQAQQLSRGPELMVATPGRLLDFLESGVVDLNRTTYVVLDEADRMLDMGFEPQIRKVLSQIRPDRQMLMWSATWPKEIQQLAHDFLGDFTQINIGSKELTANPNIQQTVRVCEWGEKLGLLLHELNTQSKDQKMPKTLIFVRTKKTVDVLSYKLRNRRFRAGAIHGDKTQMYRDGALRDFREGKMDILVATDVAARGLDVDDIKVVINYDYPNGVDDYIHRIGRTARASKTGQAITFVTDEDSAKVPDLISTLESTDQEVDPDLRDLAKFHAKFSKKSSTKQRSGYNQQRMPQPRYYGRFDGRYS